MVFTPRIELGSTLRAMAATLQVFIHAQDVFALATQYGTLISLQDRPCNGLVLLELIVAVYASVELIAAGVFDRDNVEWRVPVRALG